MLPEHVEYFTIRINADEYVGHGDELELGVFSVGEVDFRFPDGLDKVWIVEVQTLRDICMLESLILPLLTKVQVHFIVLDNVLTILQTYHLKFLFYDSIAPELTFTTNCNIYCTESLK